MSFDEVLVSPEAEVKPRRGLSLELKRPVRTIVGGTPQVSLLPSELRDAARTRGIRRGLVGLVVVAVLATAGGTAAANAASTAAAERLSAANERSQALAAQVMQFSDVQTLQQRIELAEAGVRVGSSTQVDWQQQLDAITDVMPAGFTVTNIVADGATPIADYAQGEMVLAEPRAATVEITASAPSIAELPVWLRELRALPAYADATPQVLAGANAADGFNVLITLHLTAAAFAVEEGDDQ